MVTCPDCKSELPLKVLKTCGYYVGRWCPKCGPYSRETGYYPEEEQANLVLQAFNKHGER